MIAELLSILFGTMATMMIGFFWYSVLFKDRYLKEANIKLENHDLNNQPLILELGGRFLQASMNTILYSILKPKDESNFVLALSLGIFINIGFQLQYYTSKVVWEQKTWNYFFIKISESFITLTILQLFAYIFVK